MSLNLPRLWVVATPLGNLGDFTDRAREVLAQVDLILAEDTRRAGLMLQRAGIHPRRLLSLFEHNEEGRVPNVLNVLAQGGQAAIISDAGTPLLADPGYLVVRACREAGYPVSPVPGPSAILAALMASGLPPYPFSFLGFLPRKQGDRCKTLTVFARTQSTLIFFERKNRLVDSLQSAFAVLGPAEFCVARELTKAHEEFIYGRLGQSLDHLAELKGEVTVIIAPAQDTKVHGREEVLAVLDEENSSGGPPRDVVRRVMARVHGWSSKDVYSLLSDGKAHKTARS